MRRSARYVPGHFNPGTAYTRSIIVTENSVLSVPTSVWLGDTILFLLRAATGIGHVTVEAPLILLHRKLEGQPRTYGHRKLTFICPTGPCPAEMYEHANSNRNAAYSQHVPCKTSTTAPRVARRGPASKTYYSPAAGCLSHPCCRNFPELS
jgi:hypothetical protein